MDLEQKAMRLLAGTAVFWSFFVATAIGAHAVQNAFAYANEPFVQAEAIDRQSAAVANALRARHTERPPFPHATSTASESATTTRATSTTPRANTHEFKPKHCPNPTATLKRGGQNMPAQVLELQKFLAERYAQRTEDLVTGHFGPLTERLLARFQGEQGLPPVGMLGPLTRAAIFRTCGEGGGTGGTATATTTTFTATSTTGVAPLTTTFTVTGAAGNYLLVFGDGATTTVPVPAIQCVTTPCNPPSQTVTHVYQNAGTFSAVLSKESATVGTTTITVTAPATQ